MTVRAGFWGEKLRHSGAVSARLYATNPLDSPFLDRIQTGDTIVDGNNDPTASSSRIERTLLHAEGVRFLSPGQRQATPWETETHRSIPSLKGWDTPAPD